MAVTALLSFEANCDVYISSTSVGADVWVVITDNSVVADCWLYKGDITNRPTTSDIWIYPTDSAAAADKWVIITENMGAADDVDCLRK